MFLSGDTRTGVPALAISSTLAGGRRPGSNTSATSVQYNGGEDEDEGAKDLYVENFGVSLPRCNNICKSTRQYPYSPMIVAVAPQIGVRHEFAPVAPEHSEADDF